MADLTTDQLLAMLHLESLKGLSPDYEQALARSFAKDVSRSLPRRDTTVVGETMLHIGSKAAALAEHLIGWGIGEVKAYRLALKVVSVAGAELYTAGMPAGEVAGRVASALRAAVEIP